MFPALTSAWRSWRTTPGVAALGALAFAVGIGSATAIYTVVNGVVLKPLPYLDAGRFVALYGATFSQPGQRSSLTFPDLLEYQQRTHSFDVFGWFRPGSFNLTYGGQPQHVDGVFVTRSLAEHLGVSPVLGQWSHDEDSVVISHALWTRLGAASDIVGRSVTIDGRAKTIAGVMPPSFRLPVPGPGIGTVQSDVWLPLEPGGAGQSRHEGAYFCYARRKPGVGFAAAEADVKHAAAEIAALDPASHPSYTARLDDLRDSVIDEIRPTLLLLGVASVLLFLISCADVAGLLLARAIARARETAIRVALGARRRQLAFQYLMDGLVVSLAGGVAGLAVSVALVRAVLALAADEIPRADEIGLDWSVVVFVLGAAAVAAALAGLAPLGHAFRTAPAEALSVGVRAAGSRRARRLSHALVVAEVALSFVLLAVSAALVWHLRGLVRVAPGLDPTNVLTFDVSVPPATTMHDDAAAEKLERFAAALAAVPGVTDVGYSNQTPLAGCCFSTTIYPEGRPADLAAVERTSFMAVSPGYFRALRLPLTRGRLLDDHDRSEDPLIVLVNEAAVRRYWPNEDPLQRYGRISGPNGTRFQIVGVVGDVKNDGLGKPTVPEIYLLARLTRLSPAADFSVRSVLPPSTLVPEVRRAVQTVDPSQPIHAVSTLAQIVAQSLSVERAGSLMVTFFALAALLMATLGLYGVVSYSVRQGTVEIGTRMALGAVSRDLVTMIVGAGLKTAAAGVGLGVLVSIGAAGLLARTFEVEPSVLPYLASTLVVGAIAGLASFFPAWRATLVSPMVAIRNEPASMWLSAREGVRRTLSGLSSAAGRAADPGRAPDLGLLAELVAAARGSASFPEAFQRALDTICTALGANSAFLFEHGSGSYACVARSPAGTAPRELADDGFLLRRLRFYRYALPLRSADLEGWRTWGAGSPGRLDEVQTLAGIDARLAVGLRAGAEILGVVILGPAVGRPGYSEADRVLLRHCAGQLTLMIENARLTGRVVEQEKLRRDLALAAEVQKRLLPERPPDRSATALSAVSLPARSVGGDYYDFLELGEHRVGIALADVSGKGVPAALIMAVVQASLRIVAADGEISLPQLAAKINDCVYRSTRSQSYATFFYAQLDETSGRLRYVNAGHLPPYLVRSRPVPGAEPSAPVEIQELPASGTVVGLFPDMSYEEAAVDLRPGDVLVAFTDGVTEALNAADEEFGEERLKDLLRAVAPLAASEISARIASELRDWIKDTAQYDDLTFVVLKVN